MSSLTSFQQDTLHTLTPQVTERERKSRLLRLSEASSKTGYRQITLDDSLFTPAWWVYNILKPPFLIGNHLMITHPSSRERLQANASTYSKDTDLRRSINPLAFNKAIWQAWHSWSQWQDITNLGEPESESQMVLPKAKALSQDLSEILRSMHKHVPSAGHLYLFLQTKANGESEFRLLQVTTRTSGEIKVTTLNLSWDDMLVHAGIDYYGSSKDRLFFEHPIQKNTLVQLDRADAERHPDTMQRLMSMAILLRNKPWTIELTQRLEQHSSFGTDQKNKQLILRLHEGA